ncbi:MAG: hypothetical protein PHU63_01355 [Candidatus ainarchaeum sp.]|nr:hypothetical protein [Candidatus ainarchaeum sp.]
MNNKIRKLEHKHKRYITYLQIIGAFTTAMLASGFLMRDEISKAFENVPPIHFIIAILFLAILFISVIHKILGDIEDEMFKEKEPDESFIRESMQKKYKIKETIRDYIELLKQTNKTIGFLDEKLKKFQDPIGQFTVAIDIPIIPHIPIKEIKEVRSILLDWIKEKDLEKEESLLFNDLVFFDNQIYGEENPSKIFSNLYVTASIHNAIFENLKKNLPILIKKLEEKL